MHRPPSVNWERSMTTSTKLVTWRMQAKSGLPRSGQALPNPAHREAWGELRRPQRAAVQGRRNG